eukprot:COSAG01_NODE_4721_length_4792_cov_6.484551_1_plen_136_part_00
MQVDELLATFVALGGTDIDTARVYMGGNTEIVLGASPAVSTLSIATKAFPQGLAGAMSGPASSLSDFLGTNTRQLHDSLANLRRESADIWYLHMPDGSKPLEEILAEADALHKAGGFQELGLSNFSAWQVGVLRR